MCACAHTLKSLLLCPPISLSSHRYTQLEYKPFDPVIKRTEATVRDPSGRTFSVTKGAPHVVLKLCHNKEKIEEQLHQLIERLGREGTRCLAVASTGDEGQWEMAGVLTFLDPPRPDTKRTIEEARANGVHVKMITGDHGVIARTMAKMLGLGTNIQSAEGLPKVNVNEPMPDDIGDKYGQQVLAADGFAQVSACVLVQVVLCVCAYICVCVFVSECE
jgi:H+-transporting ATPase